MHCGFEHQSSPIKAMGLGGTGHLPVLDPGLQTDLHTNLG